jgi:hypothetical protein
MTNALIGFVLGGVLMGLFAIWCAEQSKMLMRKDIYIEAVQNGAGHWETTDKGQTFFIWGARK